MDNLRPAALAHQQTTQARAKYLAGLNIWTPSLVDAPAIAIPNMFAKTLTPDFCGPAERSMIGVTAWTLVTDLTGEETFLQVRSA